ncbi:class I adenylate-forming enzyme family protein [Pukyongiella litopenaei]|uniref:3-methylmercaptopropionyl-CoA ligase n=1 Tax=Pukyongiella litopenaei TaxID=2605946 RepID=A0A2S0MS73_9RHOB|nr:AMP-binding protein [Pukyongiella litopenaei]AVO38712.1 long-chain fatty acid--CoA ligase [Pukyongiella litopenaei]
MNIARWLYQTALARPDAPAIRLGTEQVADYAAFAGASAALARHLATGQGVGQGDRVAIFCRNSVEYLPVLQAIFWIGAIAVPINSKLHPREAAWIIADAGASAVFTEAGGVFETSGELGIPCPEIALSDPPVAGLLSFGPAAAAPLPAPAAVAGDDVAWLFYTSGTTGRPKGVMLTHGNLAAMATCYALDVDAVLADDHPLYAAPMSHGAGLYHLQFTRAGACHVIPASRGFDPSEIRALAQALGNLVFFAAPTMVKRLIAASGAAGYQGAGIRTIIYGGGPMYAADIDEALALYGPRFVQIYGQGESPMTITVLPRDLVADRSHPQADRRRASVGFAHAAVEVRVVNDAMRDVSAGEVGEIIVSGAPVMKGYWRNEDATAKTLVNGWLRTGDLGTMDADGFVTLTDRSRDVIISGGSNIYPREVEEALLNHADVFEVSVIGVPSAEWGEDVMAFVVLRDGADRSRDDLDAWCRARIASFKKPRHYRFVESLPKNSYGKVLKTSLRDRAATGRDAAP